MKRYAPLLCAAVVLVSASAALAQDVPSDAAAAPPQNTTYEAPAHISLVEGAVSLERDGRIDHAPSSMPLLAGDRVRTQAGRVEVLFVDGSTLHLDHHTTVDFQSDEVVRLLSGRVRLNIPGPARDVDYRVDAPGAWVQIHYPGEYRIALLGDDEVELAVLRGTAELVNEDGRRALRAGERAFARTGAAPSLAYVFNSAAWDAFDRWSEGRRDERLGLSTQYLPDEVRPYASTFDRHGSWRHEPTYGYVWYPTVDVGWRPYYRGRWASLRPYGWTWVGLDPWAWPTHHYGRWGFSGGVWFWIPGRHWGPAWVSWAYAPGYVSWCPLGWNNRPVLSFININIFRGHRGRYYDPWHAWTIVPRRHFGTSFVNVNVVHGSRLDGRARAAFVVRDRAPAITGYAVPRAAAPIRSAGRRVGTAVPRGTARSSTDIRTGVDPSSGSVDRGGVPFRSQRPGVTTTGPGFPAASRVPRNPADGAAPSRRADGAVRGDRADGAGAAVPRRDAAPYDPGPSRRAVPRDDGPRGADRGVSRTAPAYGAPSMRARVPSSSDRSTAPGAPRSRTSPRAGESSAYAPREPQRSDAPGSAPRQPQRGDAPVYAPRQPQRSDAPVYAPREPRRSAPVYAPREPQRSDAPVYAPREPRRSDAPVYAPREPRRSDAPVYAPREPRRSDGPVYAPRAPRTSDAPVYAPRERTPSAVPHSGAPGRGGERRRPQG